MSGSIAIPVVDTDDVTARDLHLAVAHLSAVLGAMGEQALPCDPSDIDDVNGELRLLVVLTSRLEKLKDTLKACSVDLFIATNDTSRLIVDPTRPGEKVIAKLVNPEATVVDLDKLRSLLGQSAVDAVTAPVKLSMPKWEHACETGVIPLEVAAEVASYEPKASYVTFVKAD